MIEKALESKKWKRRKKKTRRTREIVLRQNVLFLLRFFLVFFFSQLSAFKFEVNVSSERNGEREQEKATKNKVKIKRLKNKNGMKARRNFHDQSIGNMDKEKNYRMK